MDQKKKIGVLEQLDIHQKKKNGEYKSSPYTFPKNLFKMDHKPKSKTQNYDF